MLFQSSLSGEKKTNKGGVSAPGTVRGFWISHISIHEEEQLQNSVRKDFEMDVALASK